MWISFKEWFPAIGRGWISIVFGLGFGVIGILQELSRSGVTMPAGLVETLVPTWGWYLAGVLGLLGGSFVGFHGVRVERDSLKDERRVVEAQISNTASSLRRQLRSWLGIEPHRDDGGVLGLGRYFRSLSKGEIDIAESRVEELGRLAAEVGGHISQQVSTASVLFLDATNRLNAHGATPETAGEAILDRLRLVQEVEKGLRECLLALEDGPISRSRLEEERELQERREREDPITQLADRIFGEKEAVEKLLPAEDGDDLEPR